MCLIAVATTTTLAGLARVVVRLGVLNASQGEADLALRVDVVNLDFNGLTQAQDVFDGVDALAVIEGAHLGDVEQSIATRKNRNEGTELGRVNNLALVHRTDFSGRRVEDHLNATLGFSNGTAVLGTNGHRSNDTVIVDGNVRTSLLLQGVDDLALWPNDLTNLVDWNFDVDDLRSNGCHFSAGLGQRGGDDVQNLETGHLGLVQRLGQNFGG